MCVCMYEYCFSNSIQCAPMQMYQLLTFILNKTYYYFIIFNRKQTDSSCVKKIK